MVAVKTGFSSPSMPGMPAPMQPMGGMPPMPPMGGPGTFPAAGWQSVCAVTSDAVSGFLLLLLAGDASSYGATS
jgi:hypothetical protein